MEIVLPDGRKVEATEVGIKEVKEYWNEYELEDGYTIKTKLVVLRFLKTNEKDKVTGDPIYVMNSKNLMVSKKKEA